MFDFRSLSELRGVLEARSAVTRPAFEPGEDASAEVARRTSHGLAALERGQHRVAVEWLEQALLGVASEADQVVILAGMLEALRGVAEAHPGPLAHYVYRRARQLVKVALPLARVHESALAQVLREAGLLAAERGQRKRSRRLLDESLEVALRLGQAHEAARTRYERASLGLLYRWPDASPQESEAAEAGLRVFEPTPSESTVSARADYLALVDWSCRLASIQSEPLPLLEDALKELLPATQVTITEVQIGQKQSHPLLRQVVQRGHAVVGTADDRVVLGAPIIVEGALRNLALVERPLRMGPFDTHSVLLAQFLTGLAGAALENQRNFADQDLLRAQLVESESHFRELFQGVDVGLALVGTEDRILEVNKAFSRLLAEPEEQLVGREFRAFLHPLDRAHEDRRFQDLVEGRLRHYQTELRFLREGAPAWAQLTTAPLPGFPRLIVRTLVDVSFNRIKSLMELEEQERTWLAADLHDAPAQTAAALCFQLQALHAQQKTASLEAAVGAAERLSSRLRELLGELSNPVLGGDTLSEAVSMLLPEPVQVEPTPNDPVVYRLIQECMFTVEGPCSVTVEAGSEGTAIVVSHQGMLRNPNFLRHRCLLLGGELRTDDPAKVVITLPF